MTLFPTSVNLKRLTALSACLGVLAAAQHDQAMPMPVKGTLPLSVKSARVVAVPAGVTETTLLLTLTNTSKADIVLSGVKSDVAGHAMLMVTVKSGALTGMKTVPTLTVKAGRTLAMNEMGDHVMLMALKRPIKVGETLKFTLVGKDGRTLTVNAIVKKPGS